MRDDIRQLRTFKDEMIGAAREGAQAAGLRLAGAAVVMTGLNIFVSHWWR